MPADILAIEGKDFGGRSDEEKKKVAAHYASDVKLLGTVPFDCGIYALRYTRDGASVIVGGEDGKVRIISAAEANVLREFLPVPITPKIVSTPTASAN
jgi:hypothetical protein